MQSSTQEPMIIDLDDPAPRWFRCCGVAGGLLIVAMLVLPWMIDLQTMGDATANPTGQGQVQVQSTSGYAPICQPHLDFPSFAEPAVAMALPSWMRLCDWFAEPATHPLPQPTRPSDAPYLRE
jgi:hypothetical protein